MNKLTGKSHQKPLPLKISYRMMRLSILVTFCFFYIHSFSQTYYLSDSGSDSNAGTSESLPWKSISKLNTALVSTIQPGSTIYFKRGDSFSGQINLPKDGIEGYKISFDAYGDGELPVISGLIPLINWVQESPNLWKTVISATNVMQVFEGGKLLNVARYPNIGYLRTNGQGTSTRFTDTELTQPDGYFVGANVVIKSSDYTWDNKLVTNSTSAGVITHQEITYSSGNDFGYFFTNKKDFIDLENEWAYIQSSRELYIYSTTDPNQRNLQASAYDYGIKSNVYGRKFIGIQNLHFDGQNITGIWLDGATALYNSVSGCTFSNQYKNGLEMSGDLITIQHCSFYDIGGSGIRSSEIFNSKIENNNFKRIGVIPGMGNSWIGDLEAMRIWHADNILIKSNRIDSTGYIGIHLTGTNSIIEYNWVSNCLLTTCDGGGIYSYSNVTHDNIWRNNIVENIMGSREARPATGVNFTVVGLYVDNDVTNQQVLNNTVRNINGSGIVCNPGTNNISIRGNNIFSCTYGFDPTDWLGNNPPQNIQFVRNAVFVNDKNRVGHPIVISSASNNYNFIQESDSNYLINFYSDNVVEYRWTINRKFTLSQWQALGYDTHSKEAFYNSRNSSDNYFILINDSREDKTYNLSNTVDLNNSTISSVTLKPFTSIILYGNPPTNIVNERYELGYSLYPNPTDKYINIKYDGEIDGILIYDIHGQLIAREETKEKKKDVSFLTNGMYILTLYNNMNDNFKKIKFTKK